MISGIRIVQTIRNVQCNQVTERKIDYRQMPTGKKIRIRPVSCSRLCSKRRLRVSKLAKVNRVDKPMSGSGRP